MQWNPYAPGDPVLVIDGPMAGMKGVVREILSDRLKVEVTVLGTRAPIEVEDWQVERRRPVT